MADEPQNKNTDEAETDEVLQNGEEQALDPEVEILIQQAVDEALAGQKDMVLRAQAEVQNMRRRCEQDVERAHKFALEKFSAELLNVVDNLERALQVVPEAPDDTVKAMAEGVELTLKGFTETLNKFAVVQLNPQSEPFDPQMHEAIAMVPIPDAEPNTVIEVVQKGYTLNGRVLRPARVVVAKGAD